MQQRKDPKGTERGGPTREGTSRGREPVDERSVATREERAEQGVGDEKGRAGREPVE